MRYRISSISAQHSGNVHTQESQEYSCLSGTTSYPAPGLNLSVDVTVEILEPGQNMLRSLSDFEDFLTGGEKIHPDAPSYDKLLRLYAPEYLL